MIQKDCGLTIDFYEDSASFVIYNEATKRSSRYYYHSIVKKGFTNVDDFLNFFRTEKKLDPDVSIVLSDTSRAVLEDIVTHNKRMR